MNEISSVGSPTSYEYKCPNEGKNCKGRKHCHVIETTEKINKMEAVIMCPIEHKKIRVVIGA